MSKKVQRPSLPVLCGLWLGALCSLGLLALMSAVLKVDLESFRSCSVNNAGLFVESCGKQSLNRGDALILLLFVASIAIVVSLFTHAWRLTRRPT
jgi:hypothetical protein